jgi:hypothetical protein
VFRGPLQQQQRHLGQQPGPALDGMESAARRVYVTRVGADVQDPHMVQTDSVTNLTTAASAANGEKAYVAVQGDKLQQAALVTEESLLRDSLDMGSSEAERMSSVSPLGDDDNVDEVWDYYEGGARRSGEQDN